MNEELNGYITKDDAALELELNSFKDVTILNTLEKLKVRKKLIGGTGRKAFFYKKDIDNVKELVNDFFNKHYTKREVEKLLPRKYIEENLDSVEIPPGYSLALWKTRSGGAKYEKVVLAYKKKDIDEHVKLYSEKNGTRYRAIFDKTGYICKKDAFKILELDWFSDENAKRVLDYLKVGKLIENNNTFYKKSDINRILKDATIFFSNCITKQELDNIREKDKYIIEKILIPNGYNSLLVGTRFFNKGNAYMKQKYTYKLTVKPENTKGLMSLKEAASITDFTVKDFINKICLKYSIEIIEKYNEKFCHEADIKEVIKKQKELKSKYISIADSKKIYGISKGDIENITKYKAPIEIITKANKQKLVAYDYYVLKVSDILDLREKKLNKSKKKEDVRLTKKTAYNELVKKISKEYYSTEQVLEKTNFGRSHFVNVILKKYKIETVIFKQKNYYRKNCIDEIINEQEKLKGIYISVSDAIKKYFDGKRRYREKIKKYDAPDIFITKENVRSVVSSKGVFKISEVEEYQQNKERKYRNSKISVDKNGAYEVFNHNLTTHPDWYGFRKESIYTSKSWFEYISEYLENTNSKGQVLDSLIDTFVKTTFNVTNLVDRYDRKEIYMITTNEIKLYLKGINSIRQKITLYRFLRWLSSKMIIEGKTHLKKYNIERIPNPAKEKKHQPNDDLDEIYDFETYSSVFKYSTDVCFHKMESVKEIIEHNTCVYASTWLYVMLHLNNAWRHGDVRDFPRLELYDLIERWNIEDITWFKNNSLSLENSRAVIEKVRQWEFIISKTQIKGRFFCSDELAIPLATAILILFVFGENNLIYDDKKLLNFGTKFNEVSKAMLEKFFRKLDIDGFEFKSRKFNKSIMNFVTYLANMSGDKKALEYAKWMRSHLNISSTLFYIDFDIKSIESLSKMLFERGEFGYIPALLLGKINGESLQNFEEATNQIYAINKVFGDVVKMSTTIGFLNTIRGERKEVINYITELSLEECQSKLTELFSRKLPSKEYYDVQCLVSKQGCKKTNLNSCFECPFHIPSIYALTTLCESIKRDIAMYKQLTPIKKIKASISVAKKKLILAEAMHKFGAEYVLGCLNMTRDEFLEAISEIPKPEEILEINKQNYLNN
ncbi:hypothetical protein QTH73_01135 [Clostridium perfringens]|nr:hypothetical protein [Clostridium perfringens]